MIWNVHSNPFTFCDSMNIGSGPHVSPAPVWHFPLLSYATDVHKPHTPACDVNESMWYGSKLGIPALLVFDTSAREVLD